MSAIWGILSFHDKNRIDSDQNFLSTAFHQMEGCIRQKCRVDSYRSFHTPHAYFGCGIQQFASQTVADQLPLWDSVHQELFVCDCILDNREALIQELSNKGTLSSENDPYSDGFLLYLAYQTFGKAFTSHVTGVFSIAIWRERENELLLFADPTASRCLSYHRRGNYLFFSTLIDPILAVNPELPIHEDYLKDFLLADPSVLYVYPGETPYQGIYLLRPNQRLEMTTHHTHSHIEPIFSEETLKMTQCQTKVPSPERISHNFLTLYEECVRDALRPGGIHQDAAITLSSGLDSSSIAALAAPILQENGKALLAYTFVPTGKNLPADTPSVIYDEMPYVEEIASCYPNIEVIPLTMEGRCAFDDLKKIDNVLEIPYKNSPIPQVYRAVELAKERNCRVLLLGSYGNTSVSYGYMSHILYDLDQNGMEQEFQQFLWNYCLHEALVFQEEKEKLLALFQKMRENPPRLEESTFVPHNVFLHPTILKDYSLSERFSKNASDTVAYGLMDREAYPVFLQNETLMMYLGMMETKIGLAHNMVLRDPTRDIRILRFCASLPYPFFCYQGEPRWLIRHSFADKLPSSILDHWQRKGQINVDWIQLVAEQWDTLFPTIQTYLSENPQKEWFHPHSLEAYLEKSDFSDPQFSHYLNHFFNCLQTIIFRNRFS